MYLLILALVLVGLPIVAFFFFLWISYGFPGEKNEKGEAVFTLKMRLQVLYDIVKLFLVVKKTRTVHLYEKLINLFWIENVLINEKRFLNLGYWTKPGQNLDSACADLAHLVGQTASLNSKDAILDVGFGYGEQDFYWIENFKVENITGLNISPSQIEYAQKKAEEYGYSDKVKFQSGNATNLDAQFPEKTFDKIIALESSFHFDTREEFLKQAFKVMKPGARYCAADIIPIVHENFTLYDTLTSFLMSSTWQIPTVNTYSIEVYKEKLEAIGFRNVHIEKITDKVYDPLWDYIYQRMKDPLVEKNFHWLHRNDFTKRIVATLYCTGYPLIHFDYVIVSADKPL